MLFWTQASEEEVLIKFKPVHLFCANDSCAAPGLAFNIFALDVCHSFSLVKKKNDSRKPTAYVIFIEGARGVIGQSKSLISSTPLYCSIHSWYGSPCPSLYCMSLGPSNQFFACLMMVHVRWLLKSVRANTVTYLLLAPGQSGVCGSIIH